MGTLTLPHMGDLYSDAQSFQDRYRTLHARQAEALAPGASLATIRAHLAERQELEAEREQLLESLRKGSRGFTSGWGSGRRRRKHRKRRLKHALRELEQMEEEGRGYRGWGWGWGRSNVLLKLLEKIEALEAKAAAAEKLAQEATTPQEAAAAQAVADQAEAEADQATAEAEAEAGSTATTPPAPAPAPAPAPTTTPTTQQGPTDEAVLVYTPPPEPAPKLSESWTRYYQGKVRELTRQVTDYEKIAPDSTYLANLKTLLAKYQDALSSRTPGIAGMGFLSPGGCSPLAVAGVLAGIYFTLCPAGVKRRKKLLGF
jgi:hypothetical protein